MFTPPGSICEEIDKYLIWKKDEPKTPRADPKGSLGRSSECGCRYCYAACNAIRDNEQTEKNKKRNQIAIPKNSELSFRDFDPPRKKTREKDVLRAEFKQSGLNFSILDSSWELFVKNSKTHLGHI